MREVSKGQLRFTPDDPWLATLKLTRGEASFLQHGSWVYFLATPFVTAPWQAFGEEAPPPLAGLPPGFVAIFGDHKPDAAGMGVEWEQELGLWRDNKRPDWADLAAALVAQQVFEHYVLDVGNAPKTPINLQPPTTEADLLNRPVRLLPYRLTNGAELVFIGEIDKRGRNSQVPDGLKLDARLVYQYPIYGLMGYQGDLLQAGVRIPDNKLVEFLKYGRIAGSHAG